jgi:hypothetical protein
MRSQGDVHDPRSSERADGNDGLMVAQPKMAPTAETEYEFHRLSQLPTVGPVGGDQVVALIHVVPPDTKASGHMFRWFAKRAAEFLYKRIHLLIIDLFPPGRHDPHGIHAAIWKEVTGQEYIPPQGMPLTLVAYESALTVRAEVRPIEVGSRLPDMPLFLRPNGCVDVPLETRYNAAFQAMPLRWRRVLEPRT